MLPGILPSPNAAWQKRSIYLNFLIPMLPTPVEEDLAKGVFEAIDSYCAEKKAALKVSLPEEEVEIETASPKTSRRG